MQARKLARFVVLVGKYKLLRNACNLAVAAHVRATPTTSTEDTLTAIVQERLRLTIRRLEQRCHTIQRQYEEIGKELLHE